MKKDEAAIWGDGLEDFSASATIIPFDPPLPLLRGPVPAGRSDDPSAGPFVLAFRDAASWRSAFGATESKIIEQCEAGARVGCSISASNKCKPPWWKILVGATAVDFTERERCEEREMSSCLAASKEACARFAEEKCLPPFRDARIASVDPKGVAHLVFSDAKTSGNVSDAENAEPKPVVLQGEALVGSPEFRVGVTNYRGSVLTYLESVNTTDVRKELEAIFLSRYSSPLFAGRQPKDVQEDNSSGRNPFRGRH